MRTFIENYLHFMKNCIRPPYEKLKSLKSGFIENSNFENNRDPWQAAFRILMQKGIKWGSSMGNIVYLFGEGVKGVKLLALEYKTISSRIYYLFRRNHRPYFLTHSPFFNNSLLWTTGSDHLDCPFFYNSLFWSTWFAFLD